MSTIYPAFVNEQLRIVGATLKQTFMDMEAVIEPADMMAAFRLIDGDALAALKTRLSVAYPDIAWSGDEFSTDVDGAPAGDYWICDAIDDAVKFCDRSHTGASPSRCCATAIPPSPPSTT